MVEQQCSPTKRTFCLRVPVHDLPGDAHGLAVDGRACARIAMDGWAASPVVPDGSSLIIIIRNGIFAADVGDHSAAREKEAQKALEGFWCDPPRTLRISTALHSFS